MDTLTHGLTGWLIAKSVPTEKWGGEAKAAAVLGSVLPDFDQVVSLFGNEFFVRFHRGISHSFVGVAISSILVAALFHRFGRWKNLAGLYLLVLAGQLSHIALDLLNAYGTQIFQPFSDARISLDLLFVVDLAFSAIIIAGLWFSRFRPRPAPARIAFAVLSIYVGFAATLHYRAEATVAEAAKRDGVRVAHVWALPRLDMVTVSPEALLTSQAFASTDTCRGYVSSGRDGITFPLPAGPLAWNGFVDDGKRWLRAEVNPVGGTFEWKEQVPHGQDVPGVTAVRQLADVKTYLWFARFPSVETIHAGADNVFIFSDLRYAGMAGRRPFMLRIVSSPGRTLRADWSGKE